MNIINISYCLPRTVETVSQAAKRLHISCEQTKVYERVFGLQFLPIDLNITIDELLLTSAKKCLQQSKVNKKHIKYLIHAHTGNHITPFGMSAIRSLQQKLQLLNAISFAMCMHKCASVFVAIEFAKYIFKYLSVNDYVLILVGDVSFTEILQYIPGTTITTDGACAILLGNNHNKNRIIAFKTTTFGAFAGGIWDNKIIQSIFEKKYNQYLADVIFKVINEAKINLNEIKIILPHNVNRMSWNNLSKLLGIDVNKIYLDNIPHTAHCFGVDPFLNYCSVVKRKFIKKGDYYLLATVGLGASFAAMVVCH